MATKVQPEMLHQIQDYRRAGVKVPFAIRRPKTDAVLTGALAIGTMACIVFLLAQLPGGA